MGWPQAFLKERYNISNSSHDFARPLDQRIVWVNGGKLLIVYTHPAKFGRHKLCGSRYIMISVSHVIAQDHGIIWSCDLWVDASQV